jgi:hypothetical protein
MYVFYWLFFVRLLASLFVDFLLRKNKIKSELFSFKYLWIVKITNYQKCFFSFKIKCDACLLISCDFQNNFTNKSFWGEKIVYVCCSEASKEERHNISKKFLKKRDWNSLFFQSRLIFNFCFIFYFYFLFSSPLKCLFIYFISLFLCVCMRPAKRFCSKIFDTFALIVWICV